MSLWRRWNGTAWELAQGVTPTGIIPASAVAPSNPQLGQQYFDTTLNQERVWNGSNWIVPTSSYGQQLASAQYGTPFSISTNNGSYQSGPLALGIQVPAGVNYFLEALGEVGVNLNGIASGTDVYFGLGILDQTSGQIVCSDLWRDQNYSGQGGTAYKYRTFRPGLYIPATAAPHTYQVMIAGSTTLGTNYPQLYMGGALLGNTGPAWIRAVSC